MSETTEKVNIKTTKLSDNANIPVIGLGTFRSSNENQALHNAIKYAIKIGYRHFDCAWLYGNEDMIGHAIKEAIAESNASVKREDLFIVSKVWNTHHSRHLVRKCFNETLQKLQVDYLDLYLVHWPHGFKENTGREPLPRDENGKIEYSDVHYLETYHEMEELVKEGKCKSIGLSNFNIRQTQDVLDNCVIKPTINQVEVNPYFQNSKLIEFCHSKGIAVSAFAPIGAGQASFPTHPELPSILENPTLIKIAQDHKKTPAQVAIRWGLQRNLIMLPKSVTNSRIFENANVFDFELTNDEMNEIKKLDSNLRVYGLANLSDHKYYPFNED